MERNFTVQSGRKHKLRTMEIKIKEYDKKQEKVEQKAGKYVRIIWDDRTNGA